MKAEDNGAVNDVTVDCCTVDVACPGKAGSERVVPFAAHARTTAAGKECDSTQKNAHFIRTVQKILFLRVICQIHRRTITCVATEEARHERGRAKTLGHGAALQIRSRHRRLENKDM